MLATKYLLVALGLLVSFVAAAPAPVDDSVEYLVTRTRTTAKKQLSEKKRVMAQLDKKLSPPRDGTLFWSGRVNGGSGSAMGPATEYAKKNGKATLEMGLKKAKINIPNKSPHTPALWDHASKLWADRAKGKTQAFLGQVRPASTYNRIEKPALKKNKKVTQHTEHHLVKNAPNKGAAGKKGGKLKGKQSGAPKPVRKASVNTRKASTPKAQAKRQAVKPSNKGAKGKRK